MIIRLVLVALSALAFFPAAAQAAAPSSAQRFADAALRYREALVAQLPELDRRLTAMETDQCGAVLRRAPQRRVMKAFIFAVATVAGPFIDISIEPSRQLVRDLEATPTSDPILRSGRAAWRASLDHSLRWPRHEQPCRALERWAASGWSPAAFPPFDQKGYVALAEQTLRTAEKLDRAGRRLRQLGVPAAQAARFGNAEIKNARFRRLVEKHLAFVLDTIEGDEVLGESSGTVVSR